MAPPMLKDEPANQCGLRQHGGGDQNDLASILLPHAGISKTDFTTHRQPRFADAPALHKPPVEYRRAISSGFDPDVAGLLTLKNTNHDSGRIPAGSKHRV